MKFSQSLKASAKPILQAQLEHPFVSGLARGDLPMDKFRYYMIQDALYIVDYARSLAWVAPLLPDVKNIMAMLDTANETFKIEAALKEHYFEQFGITMEDALQSEQAPVCKAYIDHLFRYTRNGTCAEGMAAILPCGWIYVEIGYYFTQKREISDDHPYKSWLETYAVPEFKDMVNWWFDLLDDAVTGLSTELRSPVRNVFLQSCRFEYLFWDMAWNLQAWQP